MTVTLQEKAETVEMSDTSKAAEVLNEVNDERVFAGGWREMETGGLPH